jgi:hypothetical protein
MVIIAVCRTSATYCHTFWNSAEDKKKLMNAALAEYKIYFMNAVLGKERFIKVQMKIAMTGKQ